MLDKIKNIAHKIVKFSLIITLVCLFLLLMIFLIANMLKVYPEQIPKDVYISNVSDQSATISWVSQSPTQSRVLLSTEGKFSPIPFITKFFADSKEQGMQKNKAFTVHYVKLGSLTPAKTYQAGIYIGWNRVKVVKFNTTPKIMHKKPSKVISGQVLGPDKKTKISGVNVYYKSTFGASASAILATTTNESGIWNLDIGNLLDRNFKNFFRITNGINQTVLFEGGPLGKYQISTRSANLINWPSVSLNSKGKK